MRIAVIGASGNIGTHTVRALRRDPRVEEVVAVARRVPGPGGSADPGTAGVSWHAADVSAPSAVDVLAGIVAGCDAVVHVAWLLQPSHDEPVLRATNVVGTQNVLAAVAAAGVPAVVVASSVGAYSPGRKDRRVDESWPTDGVPGSLYSAQKVEVEHRLDDFERDYPQVRVVRLRPGLVVSGAAAAEQTRLFAGPLLPRVLLDPRLLKVLPLPRNLVFQFVHSEDAGAAFALAALRPQARGAYNVAAEPVITPEVLTRMLGAVHVPVPGAAVRAAAALTWRLRLQPTDAGWVDLGLQVPLLDTSRARGDLAWEPVHDARDAVREALDGVRTGRGEATPPLRPSPTLLHQVRGGLRALRSGPRGRV